MNEITRIHIAKVAYDIEVGAKKQLQHYTKSLEGYAADADVIADIEIRMTELLAERGIAAGGVIGVDDVVVLREQLGEPYEFADGEGDIAVGTVRATGRRLYRSLDDALLGGVLSGIAGYFSIQPIWTRLAFIILTFVSFGMALVAYVFMWVCVPAARTATEKLQLAGRDVTVESIRALNTAEVSSPENTIAPVMQRLFLYSFGAAALFAAIGTFAAVGALVASVFSIGWIGSVTHQFMAGSEAYDWLGWLLFWIVVAGGLLLTALFGLISYGFFARKATKRMVVSGIIIIALGVTTCVSVVAVAGTQSWRLSNEAQQAVHTTKVTLPQSFASIETVVFKEDRRDSPATSASAAAHMWAYPTVTYIVDDGPARYELSALPSIKPTVTVEGTTATITLTMTSDWRHSYVTPTLTVYGPAIKELAATQGDVQYSGNSQDALTVRSSSALRLQVSGTYNTLTIEGAGVVDAGDTAVQRAVVRSSEGLSVTLATVRDLFVTQPDTCGRAASSESTRVEVQRIASGELHYNEAIVPATTHKTDCAAVVVGAEEEHNYDVRSL